MEAIILIILILTGSYLYGMYSAEKNRLFENTKESLMYMFNHLDNKFYYQMIEMTDNESIKEYIDSLVQETGDPYYAINEMKSLIRIYEIVKKGRMTHSTYNNIVKDKATEIANILF